MNAVGYLKDVRREFRGLKRLAERALAQLSDDEIFHAIDEESNSIAIVMKHMSGNMRSRWTNFLTTDGEKPDRNRDAEFVLTGADTAPALRERWERGWSVCLAALDALEAADLDRTVAIRGEPHTVVQAIHRQMTHYAYHTGQIVLLARNLRAADWSYLSVAKAGSKAFNENPNPYIDP